MYVTMGPTIKARGLTVVSTSSTVTDQNSSSIMYKLLAILATVAVAQAAPGGYGAYGVALSGPHLGPSVLGGGSVGPIDVSGPVR